MTAIFILQSFEAIVFEVLADQCGRRWPVVINMFLVVVLGLQSGFCSNIPKCLGVRACVESPGSVRISSPGSLEDLLYDVHRLLSDFL
ncbi:uncharacterized protein N7487_009853 [Penicillium crustosum]|uniref:uncharacterized protein n=1 Tax=Penicillium crustosum TaxID=36656 RepID=UPI0023A19CF2|nr:uncharacterized protein N7487_009853 [Penicillium crustosum]KAJ5395550.1 hypothetical protein N7487_009853 [Penicillium crustosum]